MEKDHYTLYAFLIILTFPTATSNSTKALYPETNGRCLAQGFGANGFDLITSLACKVDPYSVIASLA